MKWAGGGGSPSTPSTPSTTPSTTPPPVLQNVSGLFSWGKLSGVFAGVHSGTYSGHGGSKHPHSPIGGGGGGGGGGGAGAGVGTGGDDGGWLVGVHHALRSVGEIITNWYYK